MSLSVTVWSVVGVLAGALIITFVWMFRRLVTLFAALEAVERIDENAPRRAGSAEWR